MRPERAEALGIDVRRVRWLAFVAGGAFGGLAGALQAFQKGAVFPNALSIPVSVDALVMVLLGGLQTLSGPDRRRGRVPRTGDRTDAPCRVLAAVARRDDRRAGHRLSAGHRRFPARARGRRRRERTARVTDLQRAFGGVRAVDDVSFALEAGSVTALIGPNGAGKSTLFNLIDGQLAPDAGTIEFEGKPLSRRADRRAHAGRHRTHVPGRADLRLDDRAAERADGAGARRPARRCRSAPRSTGACAPSAVHLLQQVGLDERGELRGRGPGLWRPEAARAGARAGGDGRGCC